jgi:hypothetical protein
VRTFQNVSPFCQVGVDSGEQLPHSVVLNIIFWLKWTELALFQADASFVLHCFFCAGDWRDNPKRACVALEAKRHSAGRQPNDGTHLVVRSSSAGLAAAKGLD